MLMNFTTFSSRRLIAALGILVLTCGTSSRALCGEALWVAYDQGSGVDSFSAKHLKKSGTPKPINLGSEGDASGLAFDKSHNLWVVTDGGEVVKFSAAQLKHLKHNSNPTPEAVISSSDFTYLYGCNFDPAGNLWVADYSNNSIDEISKAQLAAGTADLSPPAVIITSGDMDGPNFVTFDASGNAWVDNESNDTLAEFSASQLTSTGSKPAAVVLSDDGSGTSISDPGQIVFDKAGNLWVPNYGEDTVSEYAKDKLTMSGGPAPAVKLSADGLDGPWGAAFDGKGNLVIANYSGGIVIFAASQIKTSGSPVPKILIDTAVDGNYQIVFGPAS